PRLPRTGTCQPWARSWRCTPHTPSGDSATVSPPACSSSSVPSSTTPRSARASRAQDRTAAWSGPAAPVLGASVPEAPLSGAPVLGTPVLGAPVLGASVLAASGGRVAALVRPAARQVPAAAAWASNRLSIRTGPPTVYSA